MTNITIFVKIKPLNQRIFEMLLTKSIKFNIDKEHLKKQAALNPDDDGVFHIRGYASIFGNIDSYGDIVEKGAFAETINAFNSGEKSVKVLLNHRTDNFAGLAYELEEQEKGLFCDLGIASELRIADDIIKGVKRGILDEFSIGYWLKDYWVDENQNWHLTNIDLREISVVTFAANDQAKISEWKMKQLDLSQEKMKSPFADLKQKLDEYQVELKKIQGLIKH